MPVKHFRSAKPLESGAHVALVAPAGPLQKPDDLSRAQQNTRTLGWEPIVGSHASNRVGYLAGSDRDRLNDINLALRDPKVDAIWCLRGGYAHPLRHRLRLAIARTQADYRLLRHHRAPRRHTTEMQARHVSRAAFARDDH